MTEPDVHSLAGPYVLDALPDHDRSLFEEHLADCAFCSTEVDELRQASVKLATQVATPPPPALKAQVMAAIDQVRQLPPQVHVEVPPARRIARRTMLALAAAGLVAASAGGVAVQQYRARHDAVQAGGRVAAVLSQPDARTAHGAVNGGGQATVVSSERADAAVVVLTGLPKLPADRTWQLWMIDSKQTAHSVGLASGDLTQVVNGVAGKVAFGLTVEPERGSATPTLPASAMISMA